MGSGRGTTVRDVTDPALHPPRPTPSLAFRAYQSLARSSLVTHTALRARNICAAVIGARLNEGIDPERNGEAWLARLAARRADVIVDVGANTGAWTQLALRHGPAISRALLFEPSRIAFREVDVTTLDAAFEEHAIDRVDILKTDAEGHDARVLEGASQALADHRVHLVQFEYNEPWALAGSTLASALSRLESHGYTVFLLRSTGLHPFDYATYGEFLAYANFVAVTPDALAWLGPHIRGPR